MDLPLSNPPTNKELSFLLRSVSAALTIKNADKFRVLAYQKAADSIENASQEASNLYNNNELHNLPAIGGSIYAHLKDIFQSGQSSYIDEIFQGLPAGMFAILPIPGIGPKHAYKLALNLGLTRYHSAITKLQKSARQNEIQQISGYKADFEAKVLRNIEEYNQIQSNPRILLHIADKISQEIMSYMRQVPQVDKIYALGSLRRRVATVGDLDFAVSTLEPQMVIDHFIAYPQSSHTIARGEVKASIIVNNQYHVDLITQSPSKFGALLLHFTGSKFHNIKLREHAISQGFSLSEHGLLDKSNQTISSTSEEEIYQKLHMSWIPPEIREGKNEIQLAIQNKIPQLVQLNDLKGEFHIHSDFNIEPSHDLGISSMTQMIEFARQNNYQYLAFSEHNPSKSNHDFSQIINLVKNKNKTIQDLIIQESARETNPVKIFNSLEIDIEPDGNLALPIEAFDYLDFAVVSLHSSFQQDIDTTTNRIIKALSTHPKAKILGHPTGRTLLRRQGVNADWEKIFKYCAQHDKWLDIDGWPDRLDLPDSLIYEAKRFGVKFVISSDAHQVDHMSMIKYGVDTARRGWATPSDIINTYPLNKLQKLLPQ